MKLVALVVFVIGGLIGAWQRSVRRSRGSSHGLGGALVLLGFAVMTMLTGVMRAASLVGKGGRPVSEGTASFMGFLIMLVGAVVVIWSIWKYTPEDRTAHLTESLFLIGTGVAGLLVVFALVEVH